MSFKFWTALPGARYFLLDFSTKAWPFKKPWKRDPVLFDTSSNGSCLISSLNESAELAFEGGPDELVSCPPLCWWLTVSAIVDGKRSAPPLICFAARLVLHFKHNQHSHHYNLLGDFLGVWKELALELVCNLLLTQKWIDFGILFKNFSYQNQRGVVFCPFQYKNRSWVKLADWISGAHFSAWDQVKLYPNFARLFPEVTEEVEGALRVWGSDSHKALSSIPLSKSTFFLNVNERHKNVCSNASGHTW